MTTAQPQTRTRSARLMASFTNRSAAPQQPQQQQHANNVGAAAPPAAAHRGPSPLSIFLANLRLLDLDLREDWPGVGLETFAAAGAGAQGHKKRVQCIEWTLFHLFALWDPEETKKKLKPFFPPLDQVQSVNLRAALLRALEQAKKNGVLGRDAIVRKTMLDECKGERLEEVLAAFSSAVLKHVVAVETASSGEAGPLALRLALEDRGYRSDNTDLQAVILAHRASLNAMLNKKAAVNERFRDFIDLLSIKEKGILRRKETINSIEQTGSGTSISEDAMREMRRTVRNNWSGNEQWMDTLLQGDAGSKGDGLLSMPFDRVWRRVQQGRLGELEDQGGGLLEQLDGRVQTQRQRLEKWESFRRRMCDNQRRAPSPSKKRPQKAAKKDKGIDLGLGAHEDLQLGRMSPRKLATAGRGLTDEYEELLHGLTDELSRLGPKKSSALTYLQTPRAERALPRQRPTSFAESEYTMSELSDLDEEPFHTEAPIQSFQTRLDLSRRLPVKPNITYAEDAYAALRTSSSASSSVHDDSPLDGGDLAPPERYPTPDFDEGPTPHAVTPMRSNSAQEADNELVDTEETPRRVSTSPMEEIADQILESMAQASPSPTKRPRPKPRHTLSLAERTRLSMARGSFAFEEEPDEPGYSPADPSPAAASRVPEDSSQTLVNVVVEEAAEDLQARTRKSMAGYEQARQKAQLERRRSLRKSRAPPARRETGQFGNVAEEEEPTLMLTEELMAEEDMEAVFRSRPKIKASPLGSPTGRWEPDSYLGRD